MKLSSLLAALALMCSPAFAGDHAHHSHAHKHAHAKNEKCNCGAPSTKAYKKSMHKMHQGMAIAYTGDFDTDFTRGMVPHHQGAIDMAKIVLKYGQDKEIAALAKLIIAAQEQEIAMMNHWLATRGESKPAANTESEKRFEATMHTMHQGMDIIYTGDPDIDFARGMIPHHQGAIDMAEVMLDEGEDPALLKLSRDIIRSQSQEIGLMKRWLQSHAATSE